MTTLFRVGATESSRSAFGKVEMLTPVKLKSKIKLVRNSCPLPIINNPKHLRQNNILATPAAVSSMFGQSNSIRWAHSDVVFPDFDTYRKDSTKDASKRTIDNEDSRKVLPYMAFGAGGMIGLYMTKYMIRTFIEFKRAPRDMLALASIEINLNDIPEGKSVTYKWRGKPVFVRHRTKEQVAKERAVDMHTLRHPETDEQRTKKDAWLVVIGICTHLGCVPLSNSGSFGGYYCPCHGSHYDMSGRIRQGPAPANLELPEYFEFTDNDKLVIGKA